MNIEAIAAALVPSIPASGPPSAHIPKVCRRRRRKGKWSADVRKERVFVWE